MRSPEALIPRSGAVDLGRSRALLRHELNCVFASRALWVLVLIVSPLVGYGFERAVDLFAEASRSAQAFPELARGMAPLDGVLVPTMGGFYLAVTLLFPFVAIRSVGQERQSGAWKLALQLPVGMSALIAAKTLAVGAAWLLALIPAASAVVAWRLSGGHIHGPELANLLLGHALYALAVTAVGFFSAAITESMATAAIVTLAFTIGSWVLDFAGAGQGDGLAELSSLSLTAGLREFEHGLLAVPSILRTAVSAASLLVLTGIWLQSGVDVRRRAGASAGVVVIGTLALLFTVQAQWYFDLTEDRRNSFSMADEAALKSMTAPLTIALYLSPEDSRAREMQSNVLAKLRRTMPHVTVRYGAVPRAGAFGASGDDRYGLVVYTYAGKREESRSNSAREILPLLYGLAGKTVKAAESPAYPGYPLIADARAAAWWFNAFLPALTLAAWWWFRRRPGPDLRTEDQI